MEEVGAEFGEFGEVFGEASVDGGGPSAGEARSLGATAAALQYQSRQDFPVSVFPRGVQQNFITKQQIILYQVLCEIAGESKLF